jgi:hypothetical protein
MDGQGVFPGQAFDEGRLVGIFPEDYQQGVFTSKCAQHLRDLQSINGEGNTVPMAEFGMNHRQVSGKLDIHDSPGDIIVKVRLRCSAHIFLDCVYVPLQAIRNPGDAEELQVSGQGRLGNVLAFLLQPLLKLFLTVDLFVF